MHARKHKEARAEYATTAEAILGAKAGGMWGLPLDVV